MPSQHTKTSTHLTYQRNETPQHPKNSKHKIFYTLTPPIKLTAVPPTCITHIHSRPHLPQSPPQTRHAQPTPLLPHPYFSYASPLPPLPSQPSSQPSTSKKHNATRPPHPRHNPPLLPPLPRSPLNKLLPQNRLRSRHHRAHAPNSLDRGNRARSLRCSGDTRQHCSLEYAYT